MKTKFSGIMTLLLAFVVQFTFAQDRTITGAISDETGPLPGVSVIIKGTTIGTETDFDGNYTIKANSGDVLLYSFVGMRTLSKTVGSDNIINLTMVVDDNVLDEVVITGYGIKKRGDLSSSVSKVSSVQIERQNNTVSIDNALQGVATGVQVVAQNGKPGNAAFVRIRGISSINAGNEPLYLLDGAQVDEEDIIGINPSDVSSMTVLKDAASTAIYGARGANGVIIITTKSGRKDSKAVFSFTSRYGVGKEISRNFRVMDAQEKLEYERAIGVGVGAGITDQAEWDKLISQNHDWSDDLLKDSKISSLGFSVNGGEEKISYFMSIANDKDTGIIELIDNAFERTSLRLNVNYDAADWITLSTRIGFSTVSLQDPRDRNNIQSPVVGRFTFNPYEPVFLFDDDGNHLQTAQGLDKYNPTHQGLNSLEQVRAQQVSNIDNRWVGAFKADIKLHDNLTYTFGLNGSYTQTTNTRVIHSGSDLDAIFFGPGGVGQTTVYNSSSLTGTFLNKLTFNKMFNEKHAVSATVFSEYTENNFEFTRATGSGYVINGPTTLDVAAEPVDVDGDDSTWRLFSLAANVDYVFDSRYIASATVRRDGSSRFGSNNKYGVFWGASLGWNIHNEDFWSDINNTISLLKFRVSAGTSGNDQIGLYPSHTLYGFGTYNGQNTSAPTQFGDPNLGWEENFSYGAGLEFGFFNNRIAGVIEYYNRTTSELLLDVPITLTQGGGSITKNIGEIVNTGWEFELRGDIIRDNDFTWSIGATFSLYDNEVKKLADDNDLFTASNFYTGLRVGEEVHTFYLPRYAGVNPANGQALFYDVDDNVTTTNNGGEVFLSGKSPFAKFDGGINTNFNWRGIYLNADLYYKGGNYIFNTVEQQLLSDGTGANSNQRVDAWNYWKQPGDVNVLADPTANNPFKNEANGNSDRFLQKGDYIRLRNLQIGYDFPSDILDGTPLRQLKLYVSGTNLWTYAPWYVGDPEVGIPSGETTGTRGIIPGEFSLNSYPTLSSFMFGVNVNF
ncbi:MAG: SusC/RagA family TonB-linked outer membrane protein [Flavobacteriaceae bacterium]|nr:SusC/RagA family TonB-linked outer membrane protein [Flavobacteriaceae bacterium]